MAAIAVAVAAVIAAAGGLLATKSHEPSNSRSGTEAPASVDALLDLSSSQLAAVPITRVNLLCTPIVSGETRLVDESLATVIAWAERVRCETQRHWYRFERNPAEFENSEGFFRMLMLSVVLTEDFQVHYSKGSAHTLVHFRGRSII